MNKNSRSNKEKNRVVYERRSEVVKKAQINTEK